MILTITMNPSMDHLYEIDDFKLGHSNRCKLKAYLPGGKGVNSARALNEFDIETHAFIVVAGYKGDLIKNELAKENFTPHYYNIEGESRNAITIMHNQVQTEIVEEGPYIDAIQRKNIFKEIETIINNLGDNLKVITINGSVNTENNLFYSELYQHLKKITNQETKVIQDISGVQFKELIKNNKLSFIKPNIHEFSELIGQELEDKEDVIKKLSNTEFDIEFIMVTCGGEGAVAKINGEIYDVEIPKVNLVNPTGSGDSTMAGIAYGMAKGFSNEDILKIGVSCGSANATEPGVGVVKQDTFNDIYKNVVIKKIV